MAEKTYYNEEKEDEGIEQVATHNHDGISGNILNSAILGDYSTIGGRLASVLAAAIDADGHFIDDMLDTQAKEILGEFTFGASGAITIQTDANNGTWLSPTGILAKKAGVNTFALTNAGDATFAGLLAAGAIIVGTPASLIETGATSDLPPDENLIAYWSMDEGSGTTITDVSANSNNGTIVGATFATGVSGKCLDFNGTTDYVNCGDNNSLEDFTKLSISCWAYFDDLSDETIFSLVQKGNEATNGLYWVFYDNSDGKKRLTFEGGNATNRDTLNYTWTPTANTWYNITVTFDEGDVVLYINGENKASKTFGNSITDIATTDVYDCLIGSYRTSGYFMNGKIDEVRIYNTALTAEQVYALYKNPQGLKSHNIPFGALVSSTIYSKQITLGFTDGAGDCFIAAGKTDFDPSLNENGFILGIDDSDDNKVKFLIGTQTEYLYVNGDTFVNKLKIMPYTASVGGTTLKSTTTQRYTTNTSYTKIKEITIGRRGDYKILWEMLNNITNGKGAFAELRKNEVMVASISKYDGSSYSTTTTLTGLVPYDVISLYCKVETGADNSCGGRYFDLKVDESDEVFAPSYTPSYD